LALAFLYANLTLPLGRPYIVVPSRRHSAVWEERLLYMIIVVKVWAKKM